MLESIIYFFKLFTVFFGFGFAALITYYFFTDSQNIVKVLKRKLEFFKKMDKLAIDKKAMVSPSSAFYEVSFGNQKKVRVFSSPSGIKVIK